MDTNDEQDSLDHASESVGCGKDRGLFLFTVHFNRMTQQIRTILVLELDH
ncbi:hypothetical protein HC752_14390 [Vibrio sp. S9_S30]|nr:hypothetical protein [Vibrio sp. S9_S30]MBD1558125.1 hypothetical protein [Vibrio sp. S9_S30]